MKRKRTTSRNGGDRLEEAMAQLVQAQATLVQNQAQFVQNQTALLQRLTNLEEENKQRFARIEAILLRHEQILQGLPEAIRDKIGFKPTK